MVKKITGLLIVFLLIITCIGSTYGQASADYCDLTEPTEPIANCPW